MDEAAQKGARSEDRGIRLEPTAIREPEPGQGVAGKDEIIDLPLDYRKVGHLANRALHCGRIEPAARLRPGCRLERALHVQAGRSPARP